MSEAGDAFIDYETDRNFGLHPGSEETRKRAKKLFLTGHDADYDPDLPFFIDYDDDE